MKKISKTLSTKYNQKPLDHAKQAAIYALKATAKTVIQKTTDLTGDMIGYKIGIRITKVSTTSRQSNSEDIYFQKK